MSNKEPSEFYAGDSVTWSKSLGDYPAGTWVLTYALRATGKEAITLTATASGTDHLVSVLPTDSAAFEPGTYSWHASVTSGSDRFTVGTGAITILPNPSTAEDYETRTTAVRALEKINAAFEECVARGEATVTFENGRSITYRSLEEIIKARQAILAECKAEQDALAIRNGIGTGRRVLVRFSNT